MQYYTVVRHDRKGTRASTLRFDLMARILLHNDHEHGSWHLTAVLPTYTVTTLQPTRPRAATPTKRTPISLVPIRLRSDKPRTDMPYEPNNLSRRYACDLNTAR
jgi:hypothetical protein